MLNKCFFILMKSNEKDTNMKKKIVDTISQKLPDKPKAIIFLLENRSQMTELPPSDTLTLVLIEDKDLVFHRCPHAQAFTAVTRTQLLQSRVSAVCSLQGRTLRVAYNNFAPYFRVSDSVPEPGHLEEIYMETFLGQHGVSAQFNFANMTWGSLDPETGQWNGVVGLVRVE